MLRLLKTREYESWFDSLKDRRAAARIAIRIERLVDGNAGDVKPVGEGVSELRIHYGPGYRVYFAQRGRRLLLLLIGGDKSSQSRDIALAKTLAQGWEVEE